MRAIACSVLLALAGCGGAAATGGPTPQAHSGRGRAVDAAGRPLAGVHVELSGATLAGENVSVDALTGADGSWEKDLADGSYAVKAFHTVTFEGRKFKLELRPDDGIPGNEQVHDSKQGFVKNFTWKLSGRDAYEGDDSDPFYHDGASLQLWSPSWYDLDTGRGGDPEFPDGSVVTVTCTPVGPLVDGSPGKPVVFTRTMPQTGDAVRNLNDLPLAEYAVTASVTEPSGAVKALRVAFEQHGATSPTAPAASVDATFLPVDVGEAYGVWQATLYVLY